MRSTRKAMGGGVQSLFNSRVLDQLDETAKEMMQIHLVPIARISPNKEQPRRIFIDEHIKELGQSIEQHGILQPLVVKPNATTAGAYTIIAGERRYRAAKEIGLQEVPVIIHNVENKEAFILALTENMQREALNPLEEAQALHALKENFKFTQEELAKTLGKSRPTIANLLRLINLCENAKSALEKQEITLGHAKVLLGINKEDVQNEVVDAIIARSLSVRETEELLEKYKETKATQGEKKRKSYSFSPEIKATTKKISEQLETKILIKGSEEKGSIVIEFSSREMLASLITMLERK